MFFSQDEQPNEECLSLGQKSFDLITYAHHQRKTGSFIDVTIQVANEFIPANKMVLSCYSEYFEAMFKSEMQERYKDTVEIENFDGNAIKMLVEYMYGETIYIRSDNVMQVLAAANYLRLIKAKNACVEFLQKGLTVDICLEALIAYDQLCPNENLDHIFHFVSKHFDVVYHQERLTELTKNQLASLLANLNKQEVKQEDVFVALTRWVEYDESERKMFFAEFFLSLDLEKLSSIFLEKNVLTNSFVKDSNACLNSVLKCFQKSLGRHKCKNKVRK